MKLHTNENIIIMIPFLTIGPRESTWLFNSHLCKCIQSNGSISNPAEIMQGVPQGFIFGPLIFLIHIQMIWNLHVIVIFCDFQICLTSSLMYVAGKCCVGLWHKEWTLHVGFKHSRYLISSKLLQLPLHFSTKSLSITSNLQKCCSSALNWFH